MEKSGSLYRRVTGSASFKLGVIAVFILLLLIPAAMIQELIREREQRRNETVLEVTSKWGNAQTICGPVLTVPYKVFLPTKDGLLAEKHNAHFLPAELGISGEIIPEIRYRGIYKVVAYNARLDFSGSFEPPDLQTLKLNPQDFIWEEAYVEIGIPDMRGINQSITFNFNGTPISAMPGIPAKEIQESGVYAQLGKGFESTTLPLLMRDTATFSFSLNINGSHSLQLTPLGKETNVNLHASWNNPSFNGAFLPDDRIIEDTGFTARWNILQLNRNYPQQWTDSGFSTQESAFGVDLLLPLDTYQKSMRSAKYAILFIALTFLILFFAEVLNKNRIHPVQYLLVGMALTVFYTLLIALSEHIAFALAYCIAGVTIVSMITLFTQSLYKDLRVTFTVAGSLIALYVFLYIVLQLSDYALLFGSIGLVIILAVVMFFSRKIDWSGSDKTGNGEESGA